MRTFTTAVHCYSRADLLRIFRLTPRQLQAWEKADGTSRTPLPVPAPDVATVLPAPRRSRLRSLGTVLTFVLPEIKIALTGRKGFGGMGEISRGSRLVGGIHIKSKPLP